MRNRDSISDWTEPASGAAVAWLAISFVITASNALAQDAASIELSAPLFCPTGTNCVLQQVVDIDPGKGARDFTCGTATYNGHKGTDFRVLRFSDVDRGVKVVAVAPGLITGTRNSVADRITRTDAHRAAIKGRECGNGVRIDHGDGWRTQYCHLRKGSVTVRQGDTVERGQKLGLVGYSGAADFPHVHISVEKDGKIIDPFTGQAVDNSCGLETARSLWSRDVTTAYAYRAGQIIDAGFSDAIPLLDDIERGRYDDRETNRTDRALVGWGWAINLRKGDRITVALSLPSGRVMAEHTEIMPRNKAQYLISAGKRLRANQWPTGAYRVNISLRRGSRTVDKRTTRMVLR